MIKSENATCVMGGSRAEPGPGPTHVCVWTETYVRPRNAGRFPRIHFLLFDFLVWLVSVWCLLRQAAREEKKNLSLIIRTKPVCLN